jgi:hypothetical protein
MVLLNKNLAEKTSKEADNTSKEANKASKEASKASGEASIASGEVRLASEEARRKGLGRGRRRKGKEKEKEGAEYTFGEIKLEKYIFFGRGSKIKFIRPISILRHFKKLEGGGGVASPQPLTWFRL